MGNDQSATNIKASSKRTSVTKNLIKNISPSRRINAEGNEKIGTFSRVMMRESNDNSKMYDYYPYNMTNRFTKTEKYIKRSEIGRLFNSEKCINIANIFSQQISYELGNTNNLEIIVSGFFNSDFNNDCSGFKIQTDNKIETLYEIVNNDDLKLSNSSIRTLTTINKDIDELEINLDEYYKMLLSHKEFQTIEGQNNSINSNKNSTKEDSLKSHNYTKKGNKNKFKSNTSILKTTKLNKDIRGKSPEQNKAVIIKNSKSDSNNLNINNDLITKTKNIIKVDIRLAEVKKKKNLNSKKIDKVDSPLNKSKFIVEDNLNKNSQSKSPSRGNATKTILNNQSNENYQLEKSASRNMLTKSPINKAKIKTIIYKPEIVEVKNSSKMSPNHKNLEYDIRRNKSQTKDQNITENLSYPGVIKNTYSNLIKKKREESLKTNSSQFDNKSRLKNNIHKVENFNLTKQKNNLDESNEKEYKNINININELNIIKNEKKVLETKNNGKFNLNNNIGNKTTKLNANDKNINSKNYYENFPSEQNKLNEDTNSILSKLNKLKNLKYNLDVHQLQTTPIKEVRENSPYFNQDSNENINEEIKNRDRITWNIPMKRTAKRSNSFGGFDSDQLPTYNEFFPKYEDTGEKQGERFSFKNLLKKNDENELIKYIQPIIVKHANETIQNKRNSEVLILDKNKWNNN